MDYREALMNLSDQDLKLIYSYLFEKEDVGDIHRIELIESIRQEVLETDYISQMLVMMPEDEYGIYMKAVKAGHEFVPMPADRMPFALQLLLMFESKKGLMIPSDLTEEINKLNIKEIEADRTHVDNEKTFLTGVLFLYGYVHEQHVARLYNDYFGEPLPIEKFDEWIAILGLKRVNDVVMMPAIYEGYEGEETPPYSPNYYYHPASLEELGLYAGPDHHRHTQEMQDLLTFIETHTQELPKEERDELMDAAVFLIIASNDANVTMEELINMFAKNLSTQEFDMFESLFVKTLDTTRLWIYGGMTVEEVREATEEREKVEEEEKEKKVINFDVFRQN